MVGSRGDGSFKRTSDLDFQICFGGGQTSRTKIYSRIISELKSRTRGKSVGNERVRDIQLGGSSNVIYVYPVKGGKISFALEPCDKF